MDDVLGNYRGLGSYGLANGGRAALRASKKDLWIEKLNHADSTIEGT